MSCVISLVHPEEANLCATMKFGGGYDCEWRRTAQKFSMWSLLFAIGLFAGCGSPTLSAPHQFTREEVVIKTKISFAKFCRYDEEQKASIPYKYPTSAFINGMDLISEAYFDLENSDAISPDAFGRATAGSIRMRMQDYHGVELTIIYPYLAPSDINKEHYNWNQVLRLLPAINDQGDIVSLLDGDNLNP